MATAKDNTSINKINIVTNTESNVTVSQPVTNVIEIVTSGPRGPAGIAGASGSDGAPGPPGSISSSAFTSVTASVNALNEATSSYVLVSQTGSMSVATSSFISDTFISASAVRSGFGDTTTDITALNIFTGSAQTQINDLAAATSSYLTSLPNNIVSSSAQIATEISGAFASPFTAIGISGSFVAPSSSFSTRISTLENNPSVSPGTLSSSAQIATDITGAFGASSASFSTRVTTLEAGGGSGFTAAGISGSFTAPSASFSTRVTTLEAGGGASGIFTDSNGFKVTTNNLIVSKSAAGALTSSLSVQGSGSGIFDVQGSVGQLFEVQDGLDGVLMSVNDISGIPILTVSSSGNIIIPASSRLIGTASVALSVPGATSAFPFTGNALITGDLDITGSGSDIFKVRSKSGSLFSVDDGLDGVLMSVNDISGLPLFEISSSGLVTLVTGDITGSATSTASFGHIIGDGSQLSNLPAATLPSGVLSGSAQIASDISGSFVATSSSLASRTSTLEGAGYITSAFPFTGDAVITGSLTISGSFHSFRLNSDNIILGSGSGESMEAGATNNVIIGSNSGRVLDTGDNNILIGHNIGGNLNAESNNIMIGNNIADDGNAGDENIYIGSYAGYEASNAEYNVGIGHNALKGKNGNTGDYNTAIGYQVGYDMDNGYQNSLFGYRAGYEITTGYQNVFIGASSGNSILTGNGNIALGPSADFAGDVSGMLVIGSGSLATISASLATGDIIFRSTASADYFVGDGSQLTNLPSSFTAASISGSFTAPSASFSTRVTTNTTNISTNTSNVSSNLTKINSLTSVTGSYASTGSIKAESLSIFRQEGSPAPGTGTTHSINVDVVSTDAGNKYRLNGEITASLVMNLGDAYKFDQSDPSNADGGGHPFRFSTGVNGSGTAPYEEGVTVAGSLGSAGSYTQISITNTTVSPLYYYCTNHGNMGLGGVLSIDSGSLQSTGVVNITGSLIVSSSNVDFLQATGVSGSFSGSFAGDGSALTGINASNVIGNFTAAGISGSFNAASGSFSTRVTTLEAAGGSSGTSTMIASGSTSASADPATGVVINHSGSTAFSVIGSEGTLFSIDDDLDGTLFTVNDRSGIPMFEVSASGRIVAEEGEAIIRSQRPIVTVATNPFTASLDNVGQYFRVGGNVTCSIKVNATASCPVGAEFDFFQTSSAGNLLFEADPGVTINSKNSNLNLAGQFSSATLKCIDTDEWDLMGDLT